MGRRRLTMKAVENKSARKAMFERRKKGLLKKASELSTLCEVNTCVIIYPPESENSKPATFPQDPTQVIRNIQEYNHTKKCPEKPRKNYHLHEFFNDKKNQVEAETSRIREQRFAMSYPTWDDSFDNLGEEQLRKIISSLDSKVQECNQAIPLLETKGLSDQRLEIIPVVTPRDDSDQSHLSFLQNTPEADVVVSAPTKPLVDNNNNELLESCFLQSQMLHFDSDLSLPPLMNGIQTDDWEFISNFIF